MRSARLYKNRLTSPHPSTKFPQLAHAFFTSTSCVKNTMSPTHESVAESKNGPRESGHSRALKIQRLELLQSVHQASDRTVQVLVRAAHFFDLVDGVKHGGVVLAAELPADLRQRSSSELLDDVHRDLARESDCTSVAAHF